MRYLLSPPSCGNGTLEICPFKILNLYTSLSRLTIHLCPLKVFCSFANHFCDQMKWKRKKKLWVYEYMNFQCFPHFEGETKHEIILTYQPNHLWPLRSDIRTLLEVATTSGNPEAWRNGACGQISWKLLSLLASLNGDSFFGWWQRSLLKNRVTSHTKHKKNEWLDFIVKSKCVWILIGMIGRKPGFILISIHPFLEAVHGL